MLQAGAHFGHQTSKWHPKMEKYIFGERQGVHIIDLEKTRSSLETALDYAKKTTSRGGIVLFVGTKKQASDIVKKAALSCGMPYVNKRWLGGTLTNFVNLAHLLRKYKDLKRKVEKGELTKYTKFEQQKFAEEVHDYDERIGGLAELTRIPETVFILDIRKDKTALTEATRRGVKVIALCDTNVNPTNIDYPIPGNDDAIKSIELFANLMAKAISEGRAEWEKNRTKLGSTLVAPRGSQQRDDIEVKEKAEV